MEQEENLLHSYFVKLKEVQPAGQIYLGAFLAFALFFSFFFGSLLFFIIVLIISVFIFLGKEKDKGDEHGNIWVGFYDWGIVHADETFMFDDVKSFTMYENLFGDDTHYLRLELKKPGTIDSFIHLENDMQKKVVYDIIRKYVLEKKDKQISVTDQILLRFF